MMIENNGSRMSISWKALTSGKLYGENDSEIYRSQKMQIREDVSNRKIKFILYPIKYGRFNTLSNLEMADSA